MKYFCWGFDSNHGSMITPNWREICPNEKYDDFSFSGSMAVLPARLLGFTYPEYLKWCESYGARLIGKTFLYVMPIWDEKNEEVLKIINDRAEEIFKEINIRELSL